MIEVHTIEYGILNIVQETDDWELIYSMEGDKHLDLLAEGPMVKIGFGRIICLTIDLDTIWQAQLLS